MCKKIFFKANCHLTTLVIMKFNHALCSVLKIKKSNLLALRPRVVWHSFGDNWITIHFVGHRMDSQLCPQLKMGFSNLRDSGICAMNNFEFWRQISLLLFVVCF